MKDKANLIIPLVVILFFCSGYFIINQINSMQQVSIDNFKPITRNEIPEINGIVSESDFERDNELFLKLDINTGTETNLKKFAQFEESVQVDIPNESVNMNSKIIFSKLFRDYSFQISQLWIEDIVNVNGCDWVTLSNTSSDGLRLAGEIGIYPTSCFNLNNANGYKENTVISGYYILSFYDSQNGTTEKEIADTKMIYQEIIESFRLN
jgi:hypothetical protein